MIYFILASVILSLSTTSTFVDRSYLLQLAYLSVLGALCAWRIKQTPLVTYWLFYLVAVAFSGLVAPNTAMFVERFSLDILGAVFFWSAYGTGLSGWQPVVIAGLVFGQGIYRGYWLGRRADLIAIATAVCVMLPRRYRTLLLVLVVGTLWQFTLHPWGSQLSERLDYWSLTPLLWIGVGRGNLPIALYPLAVYGGGAYHAGSPEWKDILSFLHSDYLDLLAEAGPGALMAYMGLLAGVLWCWPRTVTERLLYAAIVTYVVRGLFHSIMLSPSEWAWLWTVAGIYWRLKDDLYQDLPTLSGGLRVIQPQPLGRGGFVYAPPTSFGGSYLPV